MRTRQQIENQIKALEYSLVRMAAELKPQKQMFAVNGKIKKLKQELQSKSWDEYLAK